MAGLCPQSFYKQRRVCRNDVWVSSRIPVMPLIQGFTGMPKNEEESTVLGTPIPAVSPLNVSPESER